MLRGRHMIYSRFVNEKALVRETEENTERLMQWSDNYLAEFNDLYVKSDVNGWRGRARSVVATSSNVSAAAAPPPRFAMVLQFALKRRVPYIKIVLAQLLESLVSRGIDDAEVLLYAIPERDYPPESSEAWRRTPTPTTTTAATARIGISPTPSPGIATLRRIEQWQLPITIVRAGERRNASMPWDAAYRLDMAETLELGAATGARFVLVLEDDVDLVDQFATKLAQVTLLAERHVALTAWGLVKLFYTEKFCGFAVDTLDVYALIAVAALLAAPITLLWRRALDLPNDTAPLALLTLVTGALLLYTPLAIGRQHLVTSYPLGLSRTRVSCCAPAHLYNARHIAMLVERLRDDVARGIDDNGEPLPHDIAVARYLREAHVEQLQFAPHLAQHIGLASSRVDREKIVIVSTSFNKTLDITPYLQLRLDHLQTC
jgi:hypothetical protein